MAATFPCLRPFVAVYEHPAESTRHKSSYYYHHGSRTSFKLASVNSIRSQPRSKSTSHPLDPPVPPPTFRPDQSVATHTASVSFYDRKNRRVGSNDSDGSHDSQKMIIERKVDYTVTYDDRSLRDEGSGHDRPSGDGHA
jgi:hypothetical protein